MGSDEAILIEKKHIMSERMQLGNLEKENIESERDNHF